MNDHLPALMFSSPNDGPTTSEFTILAGAGSDPASNKFAKSFPSCNCWL
jgi:hypothetical protein